MYSNLFEFIKSLIEKNGIARGAIYCRVSTDADDQLNSLENQKAFWEDWCQNNNVTLIKLYSDEGITGTNTKKRDDFNNMIKDSKSNEFDLILTKEVSRFARNTVDTLSHTRKLKTLEIGVFFLLDNIFTLDGDGELRLALMATLAQEESRKTSERVKFGHKRAMKDGKVYGANRVLGYDIIDAKLIINDKEAEIVRKIFRWFLEGKSLHAIARELNGSNIQGKLGGGFIHSSVKRILSNEKYVGDLIQQKYYTEDYLSHKQQKNNGKKEFIIIQNHHEPIISREIWDQTQIKLNHNIEKRKEHIGYSENVWVGKLFCGYCGGKYRRKKIPTKDGDFRLVFMCQNNHEKGKVGCENGKYIRQEVLEDIFMTALKELSSDDSNKEIIDMLIKNIEKNLKLNNSQKIVENLYSQLSKIESKQAKLLDLFMDEDSNLTKEIYNLKNSELINQKNDILNQINIHEKSSIFLKDKRQKLEQFYDIFSNKIDLSHFNESLVIKFIDRIIITKNIVKLFLLFNNFEKEIDISNYPKRFNNRNHCTIMGISYNPLMLGIMGIRDFDIYKVEILF